MNKLCFPTISIKDVSVLNGVRRYLNRIKTDPSVIEELAEKLPDFRRACLEDGMSLREFESFGPVQLFRDKFINGWNSLLDEIRTGRKLD